MIGLSAFSTGLLVGLSGIKTWWWFLIAPLLWFVIMWLIWNLPLWIPQVVARFQRCEKCGARTWRSARYGGFGL